MPKWRDWPSIILLLESKVTWAVYRDGCSGDQGSSGSIGTVMSTVVSLGGSFASLVGTRSMYWPLTQKRPAELTPPTQSQICLLVQFEGMSMRLRYQAAPT